MNRQVSILYLFLFLLFNGNIPTVCASPVIIDVVNYEQTWGNIKNSASEKWDMATSGNPYLMGRVAGEVTMLAVEAGVGTKGLGSVVSTTTKVLKSVDKVTDATKGGSGRYLYHYTSKTSAQNILKTGLTVTEKRPFIYATNTSKLSPLQAQIELALPANRALPTSILRIDASGLSPSLVRRVSGNLPGYGAGGGTEFLFNQNIPANLIQIVK